MRIGLVAAVLAVVVVVGMARGVPNPKLELGECADFTTKPDFVVSEYLGRWYEIEKFDNAFQLNMVCITADYTPIDDTAINVYNTGTSDGEVVGIIGNATLIDPDVPGQFALNFAGRPAGRYNVLETDFVTMSTVYACTQIGNWKQEFAWVLAREPVISPEILAAARDVFTSFGIDVSKFTSTYQGSDCYYVDPPAQ